MSRFCKAGLLSLTVNHRGPLPLRELHSTDEILAWRDLFTVMGEIIPSESLSRVTYTGIKSMHSKKTMQP